MTELSTPLTTKPAWVGSRADFFASKGVLPFLPMMYVAWADGILTPTEMSTVQKKIQEQSWLSQEATAMLERWLDPQNPPTPGQLQDWLMAIRESAAAFTETPRDSLASLGLEMAQVSVAHDPDKHLVSDAFLALTDIENVLGIVSSEACRSVLWRAQRSRVTPEAEAGESRVNLGSLQAILDGEDQELRRHIRALLSDPAFKIQYGESKEAYRERVLQWSKELAARGYGGLAFPEEFGGGGSMSDFITVFETLATHDLSLMTKFGVQFGLFGGSIHMLGTERHHKKYLNDVGSLALPGCFAMTEIGHGSNVRELETTATYDPDTDTFVVHTPSESARKIYIGNAAAHGRLATYFAQLVVGQEQHGVHAFLVPIRNADGSLCQGVSIEDNGVKMGLNGVDNGSIALDHVRIPRENLLNRFGDVDENGRYHSEISSATRRFFAMLATLVGGRVSVAKGALSSAKVGLAIAIRYSAKRRQFGPAGKPEMFILDYQTHQRRLMPLLAKSYALHFGLEYLKQRYINRSHDDEREVEVIAAGLKAYSTWHATEAIQTCRECCGGQGYLAENRLADLKADSDVFTTFEGDNTVLMQLVAKGLLSEFREQFSDMTVFTMVRYLSEQASLTLAELNPVTARNTDEEHLRDPSFHWNAMDYRERELLINAANRIRKRITSGMDSYDAFVECQDHLVELARAHIERVVLEQFQQALERTEHPGNHEALTRLYELYALHCLEKDRGWFLEQGYMAGSKTKAIRKLIHRLCKDVRHDAVDLVNAFGTPDAVLAAPIAINTD